MRRLRVSYSRKIQPEQFESMGMEISLEKDILDDENLAETAKATAEKLRSFVTARLAESLAWEQQLKEQLKEKK
jgi:hypothetical protein